MGRSCAGGYTEAGGCCQGWCRVERLVSLCCSEIFKLEAMLKACPHNRHRSKR